MRPDALLTAAAVVSVVALVALAALVPGFLADPTSVDERPATLDVSEMTLSAGEVTGETATLETTAYVRHSGGAAKNVTLVTRATSDSGLVVDTATRELGTVDEDGEREVRANVTVPRDGGYEVRTILYVDGERVETARATVSGVGALTPPHARTNVEFHRFDRQPAVEYTVESTGDDRVTLDVSSYLTNTGDEPESDLRLVVTARQADANVVAARAERTVGSVEPGRTATPGVELTVPDGYNYYLDATLWRDGVILESTRAVANLDPQQTVSVDESRREVEFEAGDFETGSGSGDRPVDSPDAASADDGAGLGAAVGVVALLAALVATRRWSA